MPNGRKSHQKDGKLKKRSIIVDIVADNGAEWIKVSTITETKILFELAENGWHEDDEETYNPENKDDIPTLSLLHLAQGLQRAAASVKAPYSRPRVRLVLPKLSLGRLPVINTLLEQIRATGTIIQCASDIPHPPPALTSTTLSNMTIDEFSDFTPVLNIDCTILLALVSDLSHQVIPIEPSFHVAIRRQIEREETEQVLPSLLWPAMADRGLVCTSQAAQRMHEIVDTIGTPSEKARTAILMGVKNPRDSPYDDVGGEDIITAFQQYSSHKVPSEWKIPIRTLPETAAGDIDIDGLPPVARKVKERLTPINQSVFLFGWKEGVTTLSSNRTVVRMMMEILRSGDDGGAVEVNGIEGEVLGDEMMRRLSVVEEEGEEGKGKREMDVSGPQIWLCPTARSLLGKEKTRR